VLTRIVSGLWGGRRAESFADKSIVRPVGIFTRPVSGLWGGKRVGSFAGRIEIVVVEEQQGGNADSERYHRNKRLKKQVEKVIKSAQQVQIEHIAARKALKVEKLELRRERDRKQEIQLFTESALLTEQIRKEIIRLGLLEANAQLAQGYMIREQIERYERQIEEIDMVFMMAMLAASIDK